MDHTTHTSRWPFVVALLFVLLIAAGLRLYRLPELPLGLHYDEAANVVLAGEIARGLETPIFIPSYTGKEVLFFYWVALWMKLLGATPLALRLSAALVGLATVVATVWAVRELLHGQRDADWIALLTGAFLATSFWHLVFSRYGFRAVTQPLMQALTVAALWRGLRLGSRGMGGGGEGISPLPFPPELGGRGGVGRGKGGLPWLLLAGLCCGLTAYTYLAARAFPIPLAAALVALLIADRGHRRARLGQVALFVAVAALTLAPLACYWLTHPGSFLTRTQQVAPAGLAEAWAGFRACLGMFFLRGDPYIRFNLPHRPLFDPVTAVLFVIGIVALGKSQIGKSANRQISKSASQQIANRKSQIAHSSIRRFVDSQILHSPFSTLQLAACIFLLTSLPVMLLPSALATGDITPSNLRAVGLLPFVYVFPALGLWAVKLQISKSANRQIAYRKSQIVNRKSRIADRASFAIRHSPIRRFVDSPFAIVHCSLFILLLAVLTPITATAYFRDWASSAELYYAADGDLADVAAYLNRADLTATTPYVASVHYRHPTLAALARDYTAIRWLCGGRTVVFPAEGDALLVFPHSASQDLAWAEAVLPGGSLVAAPPGPDGAPAFHAYRVGPQPGLFPTHPLAADLAHAITLLGYDVLGEPRSGESAGVAVWWRVVNVPEPADYGPLARLADRWGFVWGETLPFHYPSEQWTPGEWVVDHLSIPVAPGAPPGDYRVRFGLYSGSADAQLPVLDEDGRYAGTAVELPVRLARAAAPPAPEDLGIRARLDARLEGLTLLGANLDTPGARPGEPLYLTLFWRAAASSLANTDVRLTLGDATLYAGAPVHDTYPTSGWSAGEVVVDRYDPRLPRQMPPGDYLLRLHLSDSATGAQKGGPLDLGVVTVQAVARTFDVPPIPHPLNATLGSQVELLGYDLPAEAVRPGDTLRLTLYWRALAEMDEGYTVFTHLLAPDGTLAGQRDNYPVGGTYPTSLWLVGEVVADVYEIPVRADAAPGAYRLEVGMYVVETGKRLSIAGILKDSIVLQTVSITGL